jgi:steroid delta-isomerase
MASSAARVRTLIWSGALWAALACAAAAQDDGRAQAAIRAALAQWTEDFNAGKADKVCDLFAADLIAQYRGQPERDYTALCSLLRQSLADRTRTFTYSLAIDEILVSGDLAVVRLVWTLKVKRQDAPGEVTSREPGMDIFRRQGDGSWKISRYMAYEAPP